MQIHNDKCRRICVLLLLFLDKYDDVRFLEVFVAFGILQVFCAIISYLGCMISDCHVYNSLCVDLLWILPAIHKEFVVGIKFSLVIVDRLSRLIFSFYCFSILV